MKKNRYLALFLSAILSSSLLLTGFSAQAAGGSDIATRHTGYLTEEAVFEALAYSSNDQKLMKFVDNQKTITPNKVELPGFHAEDYSQYTNDQYGGMYLNDQGELVLCYTKGSSELKKAKASVQETDGQLVTQNKEVLAESVAFKTVDYSYTELLSAYDKLNENFDNLEYVQEFWVDVENNQIVVGVTDTGKIKEVSKQLKSLIDISMVSFEESEEELTDYATINGTSYINNGTYASTPAGRMYSSSRGYYGITSGHNYQAGDSIYTGTSTATKVGTIIAQTTMVKMIVLLLSWILVIAIPEQLLMKCHLQFQ